MKKASFISWVLLVTILMASTSFTHHTKKEYKEVKIGEQIWMAENLDVLHFRNGDPIPIIKSKKKWYQARENKQPACCHYENDSKYSEEHGLLYNWYAATDPRGLAPEGWRIPTEEDWDILIKHLSGWKNAGRSLKSESGWDDYEGKDGNGNNISGFNAIPCSIRGHKGAFYDREGKYASWWMTEEQTEYSAWSRTVVHKDRQAIQFNYQKGDAISVRCIKE